MMSGNSLMMSPLLVLASLLLISVVQSKWIQGNPASIDSNEIFVNGIPDEGMANSISEDDINADMMLNPTDEPDNKRSLDEVNGKRDQTKGDWGRDRSRWSREQNSVHKRNVRSVGRTGVITGIGRGWADVIRGTSIGIDGSDGCMEHYHRRWRPERDYYACRRYRLKAIEKSKLMKQKVDKGRSTISSPKQTPVTKQRQGQTTSPSSIQNKDCLNASRKQNRDSPSQLPKSNQNTHQRFYTSGPTHSASVHDSTATLHQVQKDNIRTQELMKNDDQVQKVNIRTQEMLKNDAQVQKDNIRTQELLKNDTQVQKDNIRTQELLKQDAQVQKLIILLLELLKHSPRNTPF